MLYSSQVNHGIRQGSLQIWHGADIRELLADHRTVTTGEHRAEERYWYVAVGTGRIIEAHQVTNGLSWDTNREPGRLTVTASKGGVSAGQP